MRSYCFMVIFLKSFLKPRDSQFSNDIIEKRKRKPFLPNLANISSRRTVKVSKTQLKTLICELIAILGELQTMMALLKKQRPRIFYYRVKEHSNSSEKEGTIKDFLGRLVYLYFVLN